MITMKFTALITVAAVALTFAFSGRAGIARRRFGIRAPATVGHVEFEKANRVHYNTLEQLVLFIPLLWLAAGATGDLPAAAIGAVWLAGRLIYASAYLREPAGRAPGMLLTLLASAALGLIALWGIVGAFLE